MKLFTPGPVMVNSAVLAAASSQPLHHRSLEFLELSSRLWSSLRTIFCTSDRVVVLSGSGMSGIEAAISSAHGPGETVLILDHGRFGERLATIARIHGLRPICLTTEWGTSIRAEHVASTLKREKDCRGLWFVHAETSTGVALDAKSIAEAARSVHKDMIIGVDAVTSIGVQEVDMDGWGLDLVAAGSQKGLRCPPGLACVAVSERAESRFREIGARTYTLDLLSMIRSQQEGLFTWTPPTSLVAALDVAVTHVMNDGLRSRWEHHRRLANMVRSALPGMGLRLFGESTSSGVIAIDDERSSAIRQALDQRYGYVVAGGQDRLSGHVMRIGTMGDIVEHDINDLLSAMSDVVATL